MKELMINPSVQGAEANLRGAAAILNLYSASSPGKGEKLIYDNEPREALETWWFVLAAYNGGGRDGKLATSNYPYRVYNSFLKGSIMRDGIGGKIDPIEVTLPPSTYLECTNDICGDGEISSRDHELIPKTPENSIRETLPFDANNLILHDNDGNVIKADLTSSKNNDGEAELVIANAPTTQPGGEQPSNTGGGDTDPVIAGSTATEPGDEQPTVGSVLPATLPSDRVLQENVQSGEDRSWEAKNSITAAGFTVERGGRATLKAGNRIILKPGFHAKRGSQFNAQIDPSLKQ
jgi:hypothetical protein